MAMKVFREGDVDPRHLQGKTIAVIGYGNQGRAQALNMRDSGLSVRVGQRPGRGWDQARRDGFVPCSPAEAAQDATLVILTLPDELASELYEQHVRPALRPGMALGFAHGFNIRFGFIQPPDDVDIIMAAPKGPGTLLRSLYENGKGLPALMAIHQDATGAARKTALAWASGLGCLRAGVLETSFAAEAEADLFGEQVVLCGGLTALTKAAFETLVTAGYPPELAYIECVHELKQIADLLYERGLVGMRERISNTARYGDVTRGPQVIGTHVREQMQRVLEQVRSGHFAREWISEIRSGGAKLRALHEADIDSPFEQAGSAVRALMPWLQSDRQVDPPSQSGS